MRGHVLECLLATVLLLTVVLSVREPPVQPLADRSAELRIACMRLPAKLASMPEAVEACREGITH